MNNELYNFKDLHEFDDHKSVHIITDTDIGFQGFIAIHSESEKKGAFGATRMWTYGSDADALKDVLRLSQMMSYKAALAGIPYGGAKGVINISKGGDREAILRRYARAVEQLAGQFITGTDVGVTYEDLLIMKEETSYIAGETSFPEKFTAMGLFYSLEQTLKELYGSGSFQGRSFAIQGLGKIGLNILSLLYEETDKIYVSETNESIVAYAKEKYPMIQVVSPEKIHCQSVDIFIPCALSYAIHKNMAHELNCRAIVGGANNQLDNPETGILLHRMGIVYAPDYVVNAGGLISVVDEYDHKNHDKDRVLEKITTIPKTLAKIYDESRRLNKVPVEIADKIARDIVNQNNKD